MVLVDDDAGVLYLQEDNDDVADLLDNLNRSNLTRDSCWNLSSSDHGSGYGGGYGSDSEDIGNSYGSPGDDFRLSGGNDD